MKILGVSAYYHDSAAALLIDGKIVAAAEEERFTRVKHDSSFPANAILFCLQAKGLTIDDLDAVVFYDKPLLKFERLLETYLHLAPKGFFSFLRSMPVWLKQKLFFRNEFLKQLKRIAVFDPKKLKLLFTEHHLSHAASSYFCSPFSEAVVLTIDGVGEWATTSVYTARENSIKVEKEIKFPHSLGLLYSAVTYYCGFKVNSGEYKLMGLAPYGNKDSAEVRLLIEKIKKEVITVFDDGSFFLHQQYFNYAGGLKMTNNNAWERLLGIKKRQEESELTIEYCNLAQAVQIITEEVVIKLVTHAVESTGIKNVCLAGGVALNCVANGKLYNLPLIDEIYIQPASGDSGGAIGAALAAYHMYYGKSKQAHKDEEVINHSYLGPAFSHPEIRNVLDLHKASYVAYEDDELSEKVARLLADGNIVGWFKGAMEFGPRALGNRSILADARNAEMQKKLNLSIKFRESFRPFAPCVLEEDADEYFEINVKSPYMLNVQKVDAKRLKAVTSADSLSLHQKINQVRSDIPAVTHIDYTARIQTVSADSNKHLYQLLQNFKAITGSSVLVNTSFNVRGEPIVCSPVDALRCFMNTGMDYLVVGNFLLSKTDQVNTVSQKITISKD